MTEDQKAIYKYFEEPLTWDLDMVKWKQTLAGFIIEIFKTTAFEDSSKPRLRFSQIYERFQPMKEHIRKHFGR